MFKLFKAAPSANGLKAKIDGIMFLISVVILIAECCSKFKEGYQLLKNDESGKSSAGAGNDSGSSDDEQNS
jgi:hypothetical protein